VKTLSAILIFSASLFGQVSDQNVVFKQVFSAVTTPQVSAPIRNVGQTVHRLDVYLSVGSSCGFFNGLIGLEGSQDNITYTNFGASVTQVNGQVDAGSPFCAHASITAVGIYTYVRVNYKALFTASGVPSPLTAFYTGSIPGSGVGSQPFSTTTDGFTLVSGTLTTTNVTQVTAIPCPAGSLIVVYSLTLTAFGGANTAKLNAFDETTSTTFPILNVPLPASSPNFFLPEGSRAYAVSDISTDPSHLTLQASAATELDYLITSRCEPPF
jgi:hypothetical protein